MAAGATSILNANLTDARTVLRMAPQWATADIADEAISWPKILAGTIVQSRLADSIIGSTKIVDSAVTTAKVQDLAITAPKLAAPTTAAITLANGWSNAGESHHNAQAQRDVTGRVHLRGLVKGGTTVNVGFVPSGYLPLAEETFAVGTHLDGGVANTLRARIATNGLITLSALASGVSVSLSGISYQGA